MIRYISFSILLFWATLTIADVSVRGYMRSDGTYVAPHYRSNPNGNVNDNWSTKPNVNPYTGQEGTKVSPESRSRSSVSDPGSAYQNNMNSHFGN